MHQRADHVGVVLLTVLFGTLIMAKSGMSMRFELRSGSSKCISEDIKSNALSVGKYSVVNPNIPSPIPNSHKLTIKVTSPLGHKHHYGDHVESGNFAFTAVETGDYATCFSAPEHKPPTTLTIDFDWRTGMAAKDWSNVAKKGQIEMMELELEKLYASVRSIHDEMFYLREREEEMQKFNRTTNAKMATFSFLSLLVCLSVAGLQFWHLKTFFERKKLLWFLFHHFLYFKTSNCFIPLMIFLFKF